MATASVYVNGVAEEAVEGSVTTRLNGIGQAQVKVPMDGAAGNVGDLLKVYIDGVLKHHGRILLCETTCDEQFGYTVYNSSDPLEMWKWRPVRGTSLTDGSDGSFSDPNIVDQWQTAPAIINAMMDASEDPSLVPTLAEGPLYLNRGIVDGGGPNLSGIPLDWPMTMADLASLLVSTGLLDIIVTPIELHDSGMPCTEEMGAPNAFDYGLVDLYNGDFGSDLTSSVAFQYGTGLRNVRQVRWNQDMTNLTNKLQYFLGPRKDQTHWRANIVGTANLSGCDDCLPGVQCNDIRDNVQTAAYASRCTYGPRFEMRVYDVRGDPDTRVDAGAYCLYANLWLREAYIRQMPRTLLHITPTRGSDIGAFDIGDIVFIELSSKVRGGISGGQRVYGYTISWEAEESVLELSEIQTSADNEGFG